MKAYSFKKIDAFTDGAAPGNPAGCVLLPEGQEMPDRDMLAIARQLKGFVSEVVCAQPEGEGFFLRYFSADREVGFCGHATLAFSYEYLKSRLDQPALNLRVGSEGLTVFNRIALEDCVYLTAPPPRYLRTAVNRSDIAWALSIAMADMGDAEPALVCSGLNTLLVPMRRAPVLCDARPDIELLGRFCLQAGCDIVLVYTPNATRAGSDYRTRVFAPLFGYLEDPATGSGNAALGYHLLNTSRWKGGRLTIEQGPSFEHPNVVRLDTVQQEGQTRVLIGGSAALRIEGSYFI